MKDKGISSSAVTAVMLIGLLFMSSGAILVRFADDVHPVVMGAYRMLFSSAILIAIARFRGLSFDFVSRKDFLLGCLSGIFLAGHFATWITSLLYTSVANSVMLVNMNPIFLCILAFLFFREKQSFAIILSIIIAFAGCYILTIGDRCFIGFSGGSGLIIGNSLALAGAFTQSFYLLIGSRLMMRMNLLTYVTIVYTSAAFSLVALSLSMGLSFTGFKPSSWLFLFLMGLFPQILGHSSFNWALKYIKSSIVAIVKMGEPILSAILAYLFFTETITFTQLAGMALIFIGILIALRKGE